MFFFNIPKDRQINKTSLSNAFSKVKKGASGFSPLGKWIPPALHSSSNKHADPAEAVV